MFVVLRYQHNIIVFQSHRAFTHILFSTLIFYINIYIYIVYINFYGMVVIDKVIPCYKPVTVFAGADTAVADDDGHNVPSGSSLVKVPTVPVASAQAPPQLQCI